MGAQTNANHQRAIGSATQGMRDIANSPPPGTPSIIVYMAMTVPSKKSSRTDKCLTYQMTPLEKLRESPYSKGSCWPSIRAENTTTLFPIRLRLTKTVIPQRTAKVPYDTRYGRCRDGHRQRACVLLGIGSRVGFDWLQAATTMPPTDPLHERR